MTVCICQNTELHVKKGFTVYKLYLNKKMLKLLSDHHVPQASSLDTWDINSNFNELNLMDGDYSDHSQVQLSFLQYNFQNVGIQR